MTLLSHVGEEDEMKRVARPWRLGVQNLFCDIQLLVSLLFSCYEMPPVTLAYRSPRA